MPFEVVILQDVQDQTGCPPVFEVPNFHFMKTDTTLQKLFDSRLFKLVNYIFEIQDNLSYDWNNLTSLISFIS